MPTSTGLLAVLLAAAATGVLLLRAPSDRLQAAAGRGSGHAPDGPGRRIGHERGRGGVPRSRPASGPASACLLAGLAVALLLPAPIGPVAGVALAVGGPRVLRRLEPRAVREDRERLLRDLPLVLDLLAACLAGGAPLPPAAAAVAAAVGGPAGRRLAAVGAALAVGAAPSEAWGPLAGPDPARRDDDPMGPAARALARAAEGGAPVAAAVHRLAAEARAGARSRGEQAARRVGVLAVAPLGLCFLPAFVLIGVVPLVVALAGPLLSLG